MLRKYFTLLLTLLLINLSLSVSIKSDTARLNVLARKKIHK